MRPTAVWRIPPPYRKETYDDAENPYFTKNAKQ